MGQDTLIVPAAEANRRFSELLRAARAGIRITITSHGEPVAVMGPVAANRGAGPALEAHWATVDPVTIGAWTRDDLYERGPR